MQDNVVDRFSKWEARQMRNAIRASPGRAPDPAVGESIMTLFLVLIVVGLLLLAGPVNDAIRDSAHDIMSATSW